MRRLPADYERPSRSALKRAAEAVTDLAHRLAELPDATFRRLPLPDELRAEFVLVRGMKDSGARARQLRHLGSALREDPVLLEQLQTVLDGHSQAQRNDARLLHRLEELRTRLLDPEQSSNVLLELAETAPNLDRAALQRAMNAYRTSNDKKAFRTIFRLLQATCADK